METEMETQIRGKQRLKGRSRNVRFWARRIRVVAIRNNRFSLSRTAAFQWRISSGRVGRSESLAVGPWGSRRRRGRLRWRGWWRRSRGSCRSPGRRWWLTWSENAGPAGVRFTLAEVSELSAAVRAIEVLGARLPEQVQVFSGVEAPPKMHT